MKCEVADYLNPPNIKPLRFYVRAPNQGVQGWLYIWGALYLWGFGRIYTLLKMFRKGGNPNFLAISFPIVLLKLNCNFQKLVVSLQQEFGFSVIGACPKDSNMPPLLT